MKICDIVAGKVVIHNDALLLPFFRKIWDADKNPDKVEATNYISYIILKNKYDSPYVISMGDDELEPVIKKDIFGDNKIVLPQLVLDAENAYNNVVQTSLTLRLLKSSRRKLDTVRVYYDNSLEDALDDKKVESILKSMASLDKTVASLDKLEKMVKADELANVKVKGGNEIGLYENPKSM